MTITHDGEFDPKDNSNRCIAYEDSYVNPLHRPIAYSLQECLAELKWGRPSADQMLLDDFIRQVNEENSEF
jgi:hypothetical protein